MRILMCAGFYNVGGSAIVIEKLADALINKGHEVTIGALWFKSLPPKDKYQVAKIPIGNIFKLKKFLEVFDIIHSHHPLTNYLSLICNKPFVYHYHGVPNFRTGFIFNLSAFSSIVLFGYRFDAVIAVSKNAAKQLKHFLNIKCIRIVHNGVDVYHFNRYLNVSMRKGRPQFLFVGNLYPHKNVEEIIMAMVKLIKFYPEAHLQIVGSGKMYSLLKNLINNFKLETHVDLVGEISNDNLPDYYLSCDVYVTASLCEQSPLPLLEAWSTSKPVVASSIPAHFDLLSKCKAGAIYAKGDIDDLCKKMLEIYEEREKYAPIAFDFAKKHDWSIIAAQVIKIYKNLNFKD